MKGAVIDEFTRIGGGQILARLVYDYLTNSHIDTKFVTDLRHPFLDRNIPVLETRYDYHEQANSFLLINKVMGTQRDLRRIFSMNKFDIVFNNHPNMFLYNADINALHGFSFLDPITDEFGNIERKLIFNLIKHSHIYSIYGGGTFLVNSKYTMNLAKILFPKLGISPKFMKVVYIPVEANKKPDLSLKDPKAVVSIGRINKGKRFDIIVKVAKSMPDYKFYIIGAVNRGDDQYYGYLMDIKPNNLEIIVNASESKKQEILRKSFIYMHANRKEHYGISIIEAMACGLIPVVPKSGGPWIDIVERGKFGYGYDTIDEAIEIIRTVDLNRNKEIYESISRFSYERFNEDLGDLVTVVHEN